MKRIANEAIFSDDDRARISALSEKCALKEGTTAILYGRGIDTVDKIKSFLNPSAEQFLSPFLMSGMKETVNLLKTARDEEWSVVVYGDYDADGVCASTIMTRALADFGIRAGAYVPERKDGYGMSEASLDFIFDEYCPQLIITVDCGISNAEQVEYIKNCGAEVVVTDHHELPEKLPDCVCINPKFADDYPYDNLCGAGVAFKVACALLGKQAYKYLDFVAIATVADSVPLTGENRSLVAEGLKLINRAPRKNYSGLYKSVEKITAQTLAFAIAPKINAAGRMGDANAALQLFLSDDGKEIYSGTVKLSGYNLMRQQSCDELYLSAKAQLEKKGAHGRVIVLWNEDWNSGFIGIIAARLAEEYCRPTLLFVKNGDMLKGSARSIDGVNVFEALKACGEYIEEFGGHSQAAGINIREENLDKLEESLNRYFCENYSSEAFTPTYYVNGTFNGVPDREFIEELELLEPCGVGNRKPQFVFETGALKVSPLKKDSPHISVKAGEFNMIWFSGEKYSRLLYSSVVKRLVFEYGVSVFGGKKQMKGYLHDAIYSCEGCAYAADEIALNCVSLSARPSVECRKRKISQQEAQEFLNTCGEYGTVSIAYDYNTLKNYDVKHREVNIFNLSSGSLSSVIIVAPSPSCDLSGYERAVFLDNPQEIKLPSLKDKDVFVCVEYDGLKTLKSLKADRNSLLCSFRYLSENAARLVGSCAEEAVHAVDFGADATGYLFALKVFEELGLISFDGGKLTVYRGIKTQLENSRFYNFVKGQIDEI